MLVPKNWLFNKELNPNTKWLRDKLEPGTEIRCANGVEL